jgi:DnaJ-class molecular chaperone
MRDLYAVLGVAPNASAAEVTHAYRRLLRRFHPDTRREIANERDADAPLREVVNAYAVLRDPERRAQYDAARSPAPNPGAAQPVRVRGVRPAPAPAARTSAAEAPLRVGPVRWAAARRGDR